MVTFEELIQKVEEAEEKYVKYSNINEEKRRFYLYLSRYNSDSSNSFFFVEELKNVDEDFAELFDHRLLERTIRDEENFERSLYYKENTTFGEVRQRLYEKIDKLVDIFSSGLDKAVEKIEIEIASFDINKCSSDINKLRRYVDSFAERVQGTAINNYNQTLIIINEINYKGVQDKINTILEKSDVIAWKMVGFSSQREVEILRRNILLSYYVNSNSNETYWYYWPRFYFLQGSIVNEKYHDFDPLKFTFKEIDDLVKKNYQPGNLDKQGKYRGQNPFEKSKDEWDKILDQVNTRTEPNLNQHSDFGKNGLKSNSPPDIKSLFNTQRNDDSSQKFDKGKGWPYKMITMSLFFVVCIVAILWFGFFKKKNPYKQQRKQIQ